MSVVQRIVRYSYFGVYFVGVPLPCIPGSARLVLHLIKNGWFFLLRVFDNPTGRVVRFFCDVGLVCFLTLCALVQKKTANVRIVQLLALRKL